MSRDACPSSPSKQEGLSETLFLGLSSREAGSLERPSILLADDHPGVTEVVAHRLEQTFKIVGIACNGQELVDAATNLKPDLVIADIFMPVLNGLEAVRRLRESGCSSKVIFLTVFADPDLVNTCLTEGAIGFVVKPRISSDLLPAIQAALAGKVFVSPGIRDRDGAQYPE